MDRSSFFLDAEIVRAMGILMVFADPDVSSSTLLGLMEVDVALARWGRGEGRLRLRIGEALDALGRMAGHHELGFSSLKAYVLERCERPDWWGTEARSLARRLAEKGGCGLPTIRAALMNGSMLWSMAWLLTQHATPQDEAELVDASRERTVAQMKAWLAERAAKQAEDSAREAGSEAGSDEERPGDEARPHARAAGTEDDEPPRTLRIGVSKEELFVVDAARLLIETLDGVRPSDEQLMYALLGEGETALLDLAGRTTVGLRVPELDPDRLRAVRENLRRLRARREAAAEANIPRATTMLFESEEETLLPTTPHELDAEIRASCRQLARRDLEMGRLARLFFDRKGPWQLGYASAEQYARERVGVSLSSLRQRINLARQVEVLPDVAQAMESGTIGFEAARLVTRIATPDSVEAWIARARVRTVVHLREEVEAVEFVARMTDGASLDPPSADELEDVAEAERRIQSGETLAKALEAKPEGRQISLVAGGGRQLRLKVSEDLWAHFQSLRWRFRKVAPPEASFIAFLGLSLWETWLPLLERRHGKWEHIYLRDRHRCVSPVCSRHDVTLHHLKFRSHGGGDEEENLASLCSWCHLQGIHEGRLKATPPASEIRWAIGRTPVMVVEGRERRLC